MSCLAEKDNRVTDYPCLLDCTWYVRINTSMNGKSDKS
eukprot:CAMPEP_0195296166 /NCGR_PEP_ID=MMETSP0707-20130614/18895_1 /TAXON_ID=33640 /ORGANISM="Asterionellopsis glacialis, Strain CCMP134" /LENGTH=37 /DNA_ID= /DNA_START= /DNA_END= /DNA_ORIENTATION=